MQQYTPILAAAQWLGPSNFTQGADLLLKAAPYLTYTTVRYWLSAVILSACIGMSQSWFITYLSLWTLIYYVPHPPAITMEWCMILFYYTRLIVTV